MAESLERLHPDIEFKRNEPDFSLEDVHGCQESARIALAAQHLENFGRLDGLFALGVGLDIGIGRIQIPDHQGQKAAAFPEVLGLRLKLNGFIQVADALAPVSQRGIDNAGGHPGGCRRPRSWR